jgi:hypothetical protein
MSVNDLNPGSVMTDQLREHWQKMCALLVWKLARTGTAINQAEIEQFLRESEAGNAVLLTLGHADSIEFKIVTHDEAVRLAKRDQSRTGHA